jgi:hypothetical protein
MRLALAETVANLPHFHRAVLMTQQLSGGNQRERSGD